MPTKLLSPPPPSDYRTFCHPCYIQCHGQDMAISIMVTVHNNETILICSLIRLLNTALSSIFFFLSNYPIFPLSPLKENMSIGLKLVESESVCRYKIENKPSPFIIKTLFCIIQVLFTNGL